MKITRTHRANRKRRPIKYLLAGIVFFALLTYLVVAFPPSFIISLSFFQLSLFYMVFPILFLATLFVVGFAANNMKHGVLIGLLTVSLLLFKLNNLTHPFFLLMLLALFFTLELLIIYKK